MTMEAPSLLSDVLGEIDEKEEGWIEEEIVAEDEGEEEDDDASLVSEDVDEESLDANIQILRQQQQLLQQMQKDKKDWNEEFDELLDEMRDLRSHMQTQAESGPPKDHSDEIAAIQIELEKAQATSELLKKTSTEEIQSLREELKADKEKLLSKNVETKDGALDNALVESLRQEVASIKENATKEIKELHDKLAVASEEAKLMQSTIESFRSSVEEVGKARDDIKAIELSSAGQVDELRTELKHSQEELQKAQLEMKSLHESLRESQEVQVAKAPSKDEPNVSGTVRAEISAIKTFSLEQVKQVRGELKDTQDELETAKAEIDLLRKELKQQSDESAPKNQKGPKTPKTALDTMRTTRAEIETFRANLRNENPPMDQAKDISKEGKPQTPKKLKTPKTNARQKSPSSVLSLDLPLTPGKAAQVPKSPRKVAVSDLVLPHSIDELAKAQRKDKALKEYLDTQTGLPYTFKSMSIKDCTGSSGKTRNLVLFEHRMYIPVKMRESTLEYMVEKYPRNTLAILKERYIWPKCECDLTALKEQGLPTLFQASSSSLSL